MNLQTRIRQRICLFLLSLSAILFLFGCSGAKKETDSVSPDMTKEASSELSGSSSPESSLSSSPSLTVHFIDVGQGLSVLAESDGHFLLYDGGDRTASSLVVSYLEKQGVKSLDYVIASHYDSDHLHGVVGALNVYDTRQVLAPDQERDTKVFQSFQSVIREKNIPLTHPVPGETYDFGDASFTVLAPQEKDYTDSNNYSVAIRLEAGDVSFLLTGDAEFESEAEMLRTGLPLESTVYVAGHHGSASSGSWDFLQEAVPQYAVISCEAGNNYGHPHVETMEKLQAMEIEVFRTDKQGTIVASTDGKTLSWSQEPCNDYSPGDPDDEPARPAKDREESSVSAEASDNSEASPAGEQTYILNTNSGLIHLPDCKNARDISEKNKKIWTGTSLSQCLEEHPGYRGCKSCNP